MLIADSTNLLAGVVLTVLVVSLLAAVVVWWRRSPLTIGQTLLWLANFLIAKLLWGTQVEGKLAVRPGQGAVIVANHRSGIDPSFIQISVRRVVYWMVAREYCETPFLGWLLRVFQVIPVGRGGVDTAATKQAIRLAKAGGLVGVFPEGRINETKDTLLLPGRPGAVLIALKARVPIVPMFISGSPYDGTPLGPLKMRAHVRVKIGEPIDVSVYYGREREEGVMQEITKRLLLEIARLAGHPEFEPQLAGRRWMPSAEGIENGNGDAKNSGQAPRNSDNLNHGKNLDNSGSNGRAASPAPRETSTG
jgi:1-acyl-sn-glycerol-3-phosphate acyltransferase